VPEAARGHPWFAALYDRMMAGPERMTLGPARAELAGGARGRVLDLGAGTGANFPFFGAAASEIHATEPDPYMRQRAEERAREAARPIVLHDAPAEALPFPDAHFDTVVAMLVFCTVDDPARAIAEVVRVLRPGGELRFYEHVRSPGRIAACGQDWLAPVWRRLAAGCRPNRDSVRLIREAGLAIVRVVETRPIPPVPPLCLLQPHASGVAVRP
jgi:ubiquinone/menaquinone biosynthesis C-methylase UbiE